MRQRSHGLTEGAAEKDGAGPGGSVSITSRSAASLENGIAGQNGRRGLRGQRISDRLLSSGVARRLGGRLPVSCTVSQELVIRQRQRRLRRGLMQRGRGQNPMRCPTSTCGESGMADCRGRPAPNREDGPLVSLCSNGRPSAPKATAARLALCGASICRVLMPETTLRAGTSRGTFEASEMRSFLRATSPCPKSGRQRSRMSVGHGTQAASPNGRGVQANSSLTKVVRAFLLPEDSGRFIGGRLGPLVTRRVCLRRVANRFSSTTSLRLVLPSLA